VCDLSSSLAHFIQNPPPLSVSISHFLAALGRGAFGKGSQGYRSEQFRYTSLHSWTQTDEGEHRR